MLSTALQPQWGAVNTIKSEKFKTLANSLNATLTIFKDVIEEQYKFETDLDNYKSQIEELNSQLCKKCEESQRVIATKESLIEEIGSILTRLNKTRDLNIINEIFLLINGPSYSQSSKNTSDDSLKTNESITVSDDSSSEIDATPTARISPIIRTRIRRKSIVKRKKSGDHKSPDAKILKLTQSTPNTTPKPNAKMKQLRLKLTKVKPTNIVDITTLPELRSQNEKECVQLSIKKEPIENDTILPSPTSIANKQDFARIYKSFETSSSQSIFHKPAKLPIKNEQLHEELINNRFKKSPIKNVRDPDETFFDSFDYEKGTSIVEKPVTSPSKSPLLENINVNNTSMDDYDSSMSLLPRKGAVTAPKNDVAAKTINKEKYVPIFKEETVRKKAEKLLLPGWSCEKCKNFYDVVYKDNPAMLLKLMTECSKHRGRQNPIRPPTPPGYWNPRWNVASDTEQFNRENNAL